MIPLKEDSEFQRLLEGLANDIVDAHIHYRLYQDLIAASNKFPLVIPQSNTFWSTTLKAHLNTSLFMLTKAYDQDNKALHLSSFLQTIKANPDLFSEAKFRVRKKDNPHVDSLASEYRVPDIAKLESDISLCSPSDPLVKTLTIHRGNVLAHRNAKNTASGKIISKTHPLTFENFELLLNRALEILNTYSSLFEASTYSKIAIGADDFSYIFQCVNSAVEKSRLESEEFAKKFSSRTDNS